MDTGAERPRRPHLERSLVVRLRGRVFTLSHVETAHIVQRGGQAHIRRAVRRLQYPHGLRGSLSASGIQALHVSSTGAHVPLGNQTTRLLRATLRDLKA